MPRPLRLGREGDGAAECRYRIWQQLPTGGMSDIMRSLYFRYI